MRLEPGRPGQWLMDVVGKFYEVRPEAAGGFFNVLKLLGNIPLAWNMHAGVCAWMRN